MKKWLKILLVIIFFAALSISLFFILKAFGLTNISSIRKFIESFGSFAVITYILITSVLLSTLCFIPLLNESLIALSLILFNTFTAFIACLVATLLSNTILFFIGDKFGEKLVTKLIGKDELDKTQNLLDKKSKLLLPILFFLPGVPDEALCLVAGLTKIKYSYLLIVSAIFHIIEIGFICFLGSGLINWSALSIVDWFVFINLIVIDIYFLFKLEKRIK